MTENMSPADIAAVCRNDGGFGGFGDNGAWWIIILFLFAFCGWGGFGGGFGGNGGANSPGLQGLATRSDINEGFALSGLQNGINSLQNGICDSTYAITNAVNNGFANNQLQLCQGFNGVQSAIANCCCDTREAIAGVNYNLASQECETRQVINNGVRDIIDNQTANTQRLVDLINSNTMQSLRDENNAYRTQLQFATQTANIVSQLQTPAPIPAYVVQSPYQSALYGCGYNACGCGCN